MAPNHPWTIPEQLQRLWAGKQRWKAARIYAEKHCDHFHVVCFLDPYSSTNIWRYHLSHLSINDLLWFALHFLTCDFVITILFHSASCKAAVCNSPGNSWLAFPGFCQMACVQMESRNARIRPKAAVNPDFPSSPDKKKAKRKASLILKDFGVCFQKVHEFCWAHVWRHLWHFAKYLESDVVACCGRDKVKDEKRGNNAR